MTNLFKCSNDLIYCQRTIDNEFNEFLFFRIKPGVLFLFLFFLFAILDPTLIVVRLFDLSFFSLQYV